MKFLHHNPSSCTEKREYQLFYRVWHKQETKGEGLSKLNLARQMLSMLRYIRPHALVSSGSVVSM
jgi:hypothetical protein